MSLINFARLIFQDDELRRFIRSASNAQKRTHAQFFHSFLIENVDAQAKCLGDFLRTFRQDRRRHENARFIRKIAREVNRLSDDAATLSSALQNLFVSAFDCNYDAIEFALLFVLRTVLVGLEEAHDRAGDYTLGNFLNITFSPGNNGNGLSIFASYKPRR